MVEVRCPTCRRFICEVPDATPVRAYCRDCRMKFELKATRQRVLTPRPRKGILVVVH